MKLIKSLMFGFGLVISAFVLNSCLDDDDGYSLNKAWYSVATVHPMEDSRNYWLSLDSGTTLWPAATNIPWYHPKEKQRAFVIYTILSNELHGYDHAVKVLDLKSILTKPIAENLGEKNDDTYGTDPVNISEMWIGGGYLNIEFEFNYGGNSVHYINLIKDEINATTPYFFEFRHNAYNDEPRYRRKGIVSFDLASIDTNGEEVELTIQAKTFDGDKLYTIKYDSTDASGEDNRGRNYLMDNFIETR